MTESCHFDDKDSLGGSFCVWRGGSIMATTRIMPIHVGKGRTESRAISDIIDYVANPQKTDNGRLITGFACVSGENGGPVANKFQIASAITPSSYVSHHTAFEYYGIVDQVFYEVYVGSETRFHDFEFDGYTYRYIKEPIKEGIVCPEFSGGVRVTDKERTIADSIKDLNLIAGLEEVISCVVSVNSIDETKMLAYLAGYDSAFLYQKTGFIFSKYQTELGVSDAFIKICKDRSGNSKRYLTNGISELGYSGEWKLVYPKNIMRKNKWLSFG